MELAAAPVGEAFKMTGSHAERELSYLVRFRKSVENLEIELEKLTSMRNDVRRLTEAATRNYEIILDVVTTWLKNVEAVEVKVKKISGEAALINSWFKGWLFSRFVLGRRAQKKLGVVQGLLAEGNAFGERVSYGRPIEDLPFAADYEAFASRVDVVEEVIWWLKDDGISLVGVYGMPGVGKTMLIPHIINRVRKEKIFDQIVTVKLAQHPELKNVQEELAKDLGVRFEDDDTLSRRARRLSHRLEQDRKTLIILDNLWVRIELSDLGIPLRACKVVFTTRDETVCNSMETKNARIEVPVLSEEESRTLFRKKAGDVVDSKKITGIAEEILKKCGGLPLAIVTLGRALYGKDQLTWTNARRELQKLRGMQVVLSCIKLSYDYMPTKEEKMCLLFCSMFSSLYPITEDQLFQYMMGENQIEDVEDLAKARSSLHSIVGRLISASLLLKAENGRIRMHDVVREVAIAIACEEDNGFIIKAGSELKDWPEMQLNPCKRLSLMYTTVECRVPNQIIGKSLLTLSFHGNVGLDELPSGFFEEMTGLMTLDLSYTGITALPDSIDCLVNLRTLRLEGCDVTDVLLSNKLGSLQILSLCYSNIERLHVSGEILGLKLLDLSSTQRLESISPKVISRCPRLEELYALKSKGWTSQSANGGERILSGVIFLSHLRTLELHIESEEFLSRNIPCWGSLERFKLVVGYVNKFNSVGVAGDRMQSNSMYLQFRTMPLFADWVRVLLQKTESLHLDGGWSFGDGWDTVEVFCQLTGNWSAHGMFCQLRDLTISGYKGTKLFASFRFLWELSHLEKLVVEDCRELKSLIKISGVSTIQQFPILPNLMYLRVSYCDDMMFLLNNGGLSSMVCESIWVLPKLKFLNLLGLKSLGLSARDYQLEEKSGYWTEKNHYSFVSEGILMDLPALEELIVEGAPNVRKLPLCDVPKLTKFAADYDWFDQLEWKDQSLRFRLQYLLKYLHLDGHSPNPREISNYSDLRTLKVSNHGLASHVPYDLLMSLQNVEDLMLDNCPDLERLIEFDQDYWESKGQASIVGASVGPSSPTSISMSKVFPKLTFLRITSSGKLQHLFKVGAVLDLLKLEKLYIKSCSSIEMVIMNEMSQVQEQPPLVRSSIGAGVIASARKGKLFPELKVLDISYCDKLRYFFPVRVVGDLLKLEEISVSYCSSFEAVFEHEKVEAEEEQLSLFHIPDGVGSMLNASMSNLISANAYIGAASRGASSSISTTTNKSSVLPPSPVLSNLTILRVSNCSMLKYIFPLETIQNMLQLKEIHIGCCSSMEMIVAPGIHGADNSKVVFPELKVLSLRQLPKLLSLAGQNLLTYFPALEELTVRDCGRLEKLPLASLASVPNLMKFTAHPFWFADLEWEDQHLQSHLERLLNYVHLQGHIGSDESLHNMKALKVSGVHSRRSHSVIPSDFLVSLLKLEMLVVKDCSASDRLFECEEQNEMAQEQESIVYSSLGASSSSWTRAREFPKLPPFPIVFYLSHIKVCNCSKVKYLFPAGVVRGLSKLVELHISDCSSLEMIIIHEELPNDYGFLKKDRALLPKLKILRLQGLKELSRFVRGDILFDWPSLEELTLNSCSALKKLPFGPGSVPKLAKLEMSPSKALFDKLEWDNEKFKDRLKKLL